ncbi:MAG: DNA internalization-related competence protein ComEC/Rec2 [Thermodesulfobacteriota bacterium]
MNKTLRLPLIPVFLAYTLGLYLGRFDFPFRLQGLVFLFPLLFAFWAFLLWIKKTRWGSWTAFVLFFLLGILPIHNVLYPRHSPSHISHYVGFDPVSLEGVIDRPPQHTQERIHLRVRSEKVVLSGDYTPVDGLLLLILKKESGPFHLGDRLRFLCKLYSPHGFHNPGGFSYERHLAFDRIYTIGFLSHDQSWVKIGAGFKNPVLLQIDRWRDHIRNFLEKESQPRASSILKALVLGEQGDISEEVKEHFITTGIAHLLAISGDHLGIVALLSFSLLIWILKRSEFFLLSFSVKKLAAGLTIPSILLYTFIAGGGISIIRATVMVITFFLSILFNRERTLLHTLALAAFLILLVSPPSLFDVSFQLSFLSVLSILYLVPRIFKRLKKDEISLPSKESALQTVLKYTKLSLLVTAVAILGTAPFVALHFNRISLLGFITNLFFIPWVGFIIVPVSLIASVLSFVFHPLAAFFIHLNEWITMALLKAVAFFASFPFASFYVSTPTPFEIILFYVLLFLMVHLQVRKRVRYLFLGVSVLLILVLVFWNLKGYLQKDLTLTFIDVGQGDSILIEFPKGKKMLIDGGGLYEDRFDTGKNVIAPFLWKKKIRRIDYLVLTHPDPDHLKGLHFIASQFSIGQFWESGVRTDSKSYQQLEETLLRKRIERLSLNESRLPRVIHGAQISFLNPSGRTTYNAGLSAPSFSNNSSVVMMIQFKDVRVLLPGDIEKETEYRMLREGCLLKADILKIPHHGSLSSSSPYFLQRVNPTYAIMSVGQRNIGRLPHPEVIKRYRHLGAKIYRTDKQGAITVRTDGEKIKVETFLQK